MLKNMRLYMSGERRTW